MKAINGALQVKTTKSRSLQRILGLLLVVMVTSALFPLTAVASSETTNN